MIDATSSILVARRGAKTADLLGEERREADGGAVLQVRAYRLEADRQSARSQARWEGRGRLAGQRRHGRVAELEIVAGGGAVDGVCAKRERSLRRHVREGGHAVRRAEEDVPFREEGAVGGAVLFSLPEPAEEVGGARRQAACPRLLELVASLGAQPLD